MVVSGDGCLIIIADYENPICSPYDKTVTMVSYEGLGSMQVKVHLHLSLNVLVVLFLFDSRYTLHKQIENKTNFCDRMNSLVFRFDHPNSFLHYSLIRYKGNYWYTIDLRPSLGLDFIGSDDISNFVSISLADSV